MLVFGAVLIASRLVTVFPALFKMRQGHRMSLVPAINLSQLSELSLVLLAIGKASGDVSEKSVSIAAFAFAFLAVTSTYGILKSDAIVRRISPSLAKLGLPDLPGGPADAHPGENPRTIFLLGFFETASSLLEEIARDRPTLLPRVKVIDFNPEVIAKLRARGIEVVYGDISQRDVLEHAGVGHAETLVCTLPDSVLRGTSNRKLLRQLRELNPDAGIIVHAERIADVAVFYDEGASYVMTPRLLEARDLLGVLDAAEHDLDAEVRRAQQESLGDRREVVP
jgi:voltage-gated potassium channel Kch